MLHTKIAKNSPSAHHCTNLSGFIIATKARIDNRNNLLNGNISSIRFYNMVNFSPLTAEISWRIWGTPANFNGFRVLASLLQRRRSTEANQTLHLCTMFSSLLRWYTIHTFSGLLPRNGILPGAKFTLRPSFALSYSLLAALLHGS